MAKFTHKQMQDSKLCAQVWTSVSVGVAGDSGVCCNMTSLPKQPEKLENQSISTFLHSPKTIEIRNLMMEGKEPRECRLCFEREAMGNNSIRHYKNDVHFRTNDEFDTEKVELQLAEVQIGNLCQLRCIICSPDRSIKIQGFQDFDATRRSIPIMSFPKYDWYENDQTIMDMADQFKDLRELFLNGGEPLLVPAHTKLIKRLIELGYAKNIALKYATNGLLINEEHRAMWKEFKTLELILSVDDIEDRYRFVRYPGNWDQLVKKLDYVKEIYEQDFKQGSQMGIYVVVNLLNFLYLDEFVKFFSTNYPFIDLGMTTIQTPDYLSPINLPIEMRTEICNKILGAIAMSNYDDHHKCRLIAEVNMIQASTANPDLLKEGLKYVANFEEYYKLNTRETFGRLANILDDNND
jgi:organic radical activating enzyme